METTQAKLQTAQIISGFFSDPEKNAGAKGNFTGYDAQGRQFFVSKKQMNETLKILKDKDFKPFFITVITKEFNELNEDGTNREDADGKEIKFSRVQSGACFLTSDDADDAVIQSELQSINQEKKIGLAKDASNAEIGLAKLVSAQKIAEKAKDLELTPEMVNRLVNSL